MMWELAHTFVACARGRVGIPSWQIDKAHTMLNRISKRYNQRKVGEVMAVQSKGAILDPSQHSKGGKVPDGDYVIKSVTCEMFDYGGTVEAGPALCFVFEADGQTHEQYYSAGKAERLVPSDDKRRMVHPRGEAATWSEGSNASLMLSSLMKSGFPTAKLTGDDVTVFNGTRVTITAVAQQKRGLANEKEGKVISLVTKVLALPGEKASATSRPTPAGRAPAASPSTTPATSAASSAGANGQLDEVAISAV